MQAPADPCLVRLAQPNVPIKISLADGRQFDGLAWKTTSFDIAKLMGLPSAQLEALVIAKVSERAGETSWLALSPQVPKARALYSFAHALSFAPGLG